MEWAKNIIIIIMAKSSYALCLYDFPNTDEHGSLIFIMNIVSFV